MEANFPYPFLRFCLFLIGAGYGQSNPCGPAISPTIDLNQVPPGNVSFQFTSATGSNGADGNPVILDGISISGNNFTDLITPDAIAYFFNNPDTQKRVVSDGNNTILGTAADGPATFEPLVLAQAKTGT